MALSKGIVLSVDVNSLNMRFPSNDVNVQLKGMEKLIEKLQGLLKEDANNAPGYKSESINNQVTALKLEKARLCFQPRPVNP